VGKEFITPSRLEAAKALLKIEKGAKVADVLEVKGLIPEDMALLRELVYGVTRQKRILDYQLGKLCQSPFEKLPIEVRISLRMGLYQLMYLTRIPAHAAVHETVNLVKAGGQEALAGFTNAVLRNAETKRAEFTVEGESEKDTLALRYSHPTWMVKRWAAVYPPETLEKILEANNQPHPVFLRTRPGKSEQVQELLKTQQIRVEPLVWPPDTLKLVSHEGGLFTGDSFQQGDWFVQDWSPQAMLELLPFEKVSRAWDVCAAPGGKTAGLSWKIDQKGEVWATDFSPIRRENLKENIKRLGLANVKFFEDPIERLSPAQKFDLIWVDAPCSGTGVLSRRADLRWKLKREEIKNHAEEQLKLMEEVQGHLYPKGFVVYTTCSLETEENQSLVQAFLTKHPDWAPMPLASPMELESVDKSEWGMTFLPTKDRDGGFLSVLQKK
jgi:16S rRNA (cytosine967-C5)-methyltransferase